MPKPSHRAVPLTGKSDLGMFPGRLLHASARALRAAGEDPVPLLTSLGLSVTTLVNEARIPHSLGERLYELASQTVGDPAFGLQIGVHTDSADHGELGALAGLLALSQDLFGTFERFATLLHDRATVHWRKEGERVVVAVELTGLRMSRPVQDAVLAGIVQRIRTLAPVPWSPREVRFSYPRPSDVAPYERHFACPVVFASEETALLVRGRWLAERLPKPVLARTITSYLGTMATQAPDGEDATRQVRDAVLSGRLSDGWTLDSVARVLRTSRRTLSRRLAEQGTTFQAELDGLRYELAREQLAASRSLQEIAEALGFSDPRAFTRAYKRWSGSTPSEAKLQLPPSNSKSLNVTPARQPPSLP